MARLQRDRVPSAPPSLLWTTRADGLLIECLARLYLSGIYVEVRLNGAPAIGRTFVTSDEAICFSDHQRQLWGDSSNASAPLK